MNPRLRGIVVLGVFVVLLIAGILNLRSTSGPSAPPVVAAGATVHDAASACQVWGQVRTIISDAVQSNDPTALYRLESTGGPHKSYISLMTWAGLAYARQQSIVLSSDLTNIKDEISSAAAGAGSLSNLPVPATTIDGQCQSATPNANP